MTTPRDSGEGFDAGAEEGPDAGGIPETDAGSVPVDAGSDAPRDAGTSDAGGPVTFDAGRPFESVPVTVQPADPAARRTVAQVLSWLKSLERRPYRRLILGQFGWPTGSGRSGNWDDIFTVTGEYPGFIETNFYGWSDDENGVVARRNVLRDAFNAGSLVGLHLPWPPNPWTQGRNTDVTLPAGRRFSECFTPGTSANERLKASLDAVAKHLAILDSEGVVVFFRPYHENNGNWFWWSARNATVAEYQQLYRWTFQYLTSEKKLHNLIWVYSPSTAEPTLPANSAVERYPGDAYVDVVATSIYAYPVVPTRVELINETAVRNYGALRAASTKLMAIGETGWSNQVETEPPVRSRDARTQLFEPVLTKMPQVTYVVTWDHRASLSQQNSAASVYHDLAHLTRRHVGRTDLFVEFENRLAKDKLFLTAPNAVAKVSPNARRWSVEAGTDGSVAIRDEETRLYLSSGTGAQAASVIATTSKSDASWWTIRDAGDGYFFLVNRASGRGLKLSPNSNEVFASTFIGLSDMMWRLR
jgi:hypothetical protein